MTNPMKNLTAQQIMEAISEGVRRALSDLINDETETPQMDFFDAITNGVAMAVENKFEEEEYLARLIEKKVTRN